MKRDKGLKKGKGKPKGQRPPKPKPSDLQEKNHEATRQALQPMSFPVLDLGNKFNFLNINISNLINISNNSFKFPDGGNSKLVYILLGCVITLLIVVLFTVLFLDFHFPLSLFLKNLLNLCIKVVLFISDV